LRQCCELAAVALEHDAGNRAAAAQMLRASVELAPTRWLNVAPKSL